MTELTQFLRLVYPLVATAAEPAALNALRLAAIQFYAKSNLWVEAMDPMTASAGVSDYELEPPAQAQIATIMSVSFDGRPITPRSHDELDKIYANDDWLTIHGAPSFYTQFDDSTIRLVPIPTITVPNGVTVRAAYMPTMNATEVPDELYNSYAQDMAFGAAAILLREQDREYSDKNMSVFYERKFRSAIDTATIMANRSRVRSPMRVQYVRL